MELDYYYFADIYVSPKKIVSVFMYHNYCNIYCIVAVLLLLALTCLLAMAKPYKENYKFHSTTDTVLMLLLTMFYGLLVSGRIVNTTVGSYYFSNGSEISHSRITFVYIAIMVLQ